MDSKRWGGSVTVDGDSAFVRRIEDRDIRYDIPGIARVKGLAREVHEAVLSGTRASVWVTPVIVVWGDFAQMVAGDKCKFVHGDALAQWLREQPLRIAPVRVEQIAEAVAGALAAPDLPHPSAHSVRP